MVEEEGFFSFLFMFLFGGVLGESVEEQGHGLTHGPSDEDQQRKDSESDLDSRPDGDTERQVELVLNGDGDGTDVLGH